MLWALVLLPGCFGGLAETKHRHFLLDGRLSAARGYAHGTTIATPPARDALLWVRDFQVDAVYDRSQLVHRRGPHEVTFERDDLWAARVGRMTADALARTWTEQGVFSAISRTPGEASQDYTLLGEITALEILDQGPNAPAAGHLAWVLQLVASHTGKVVSQAVFDDTYPLANHADSGPAAVDALNALLQRATLASCALLLAPTTVEGATPRSF